MHKIWTEQDLNAPADKAWALLTNPIHWPTWGPSVRSVEFDDEGLELGSTGTITTAFGPRLRFEITSYDEGSQWGWKVAGIGATDHRVTALPDGRCRVGFGVPWIAAAYLAVCQVALQRIKSMAEETEDST